MRATGLLLVATALLCRGATAEKYKVDLYVESLCPYCQALVRDTERVFENGVQSQMNFNMYYAGNARLVDGVVVCQHGEAECYMNKALGCGMARKETQEEWFPFVACLERGISAAVEAAKEVEPCSLIWRGSSEVTVCAREYADYERAVEICAEQSGLDAQDLLTCANGSEGEKIQMEAFQAVDSLQPPHRYVPWMVINDMPVYDVAYYLETVLCLQMDPADRPNDCYAEDLSTVSVNSASPVALRRTYPLNPAVVV